MALQQGTQLPPYQMPAPNAYEVAWLAVLPTTTPKLSTDEVTRVRAIRSWAVDSRVRDRAQAVLDANGTP